MTGEGRATVVHGQARDLAHDGAEAPTRFELREADFVIARQGAAPVAAAYRDITTLTVDGGRLLLVLGGGALRLIAQQLGAGLGTLVGELRERRARQGLGDRLIDLPGDDRLELVEYRAGDEHGVAQLGYHAWGMALLPIDERRPWRLIRRSDIDEVRADRSSGSVSVVAREDRFELMGLGAQHERHAAKVALLRDTALGDAAAIVARMLPDAGLELRQAASSLLIDGRPVSRDQLASGWDAIEGAVLADPEYAITYRLLRQRSPDAGSWLSIAPVRPGDPSDHRAWFFVSLPNDLVAMEHVSDGSHATYLFRANGDPGATVRDVSECLIDSRFLREPIYMTQEQLAAPENTRYRLAIAALPSLRGARARFVRRLIHTDEDAWLAALDSSISGGA